MVAQVTAPDHTTQNGTGYKSNLDAAAAALTRLGLSFLPQAQATPDMTVRVLAGQLFKSAALTAVAAQNTGTITAPVGNPRIDRVVLNLSSGAVEVITGTPAGSPTAPSIPADRWPICQVLLQTSTTAIGASMITDERAVPTGTAALRDVGTGSTQIPTNADIQTGTETITAGEDLVAPNVIYQDTGDQRGGGATKWYKVDTDATGPVKIARRIGIALATIASGATGLAQVRPGRVAGFSGLTAGGEVWASATAGGVTQTAPAVPSTGTQNATRSLGVAVSTTEVAFDPDPRTVFTARDSALANAGTLVVEHFPDTGARERISMAYLVAVAATQTQISQATGTTIGDMTGNGGIAAARDGTTSQANTACAQLLGAGGLIGVDWGSGNSKTLTGFKFWGPNNEYINSNSAGSTITLTLYGGNSGLGVSGTNLGSMSFTDDNIGTLRSKLSGLTTTTAYRYHWIAITSSASFAGGSSRCAEIQFFEDLISYDEPIAPVPESRNSASTNDVTVRFADASNANADTKSTFRNRLNATLDIAAEIVL